MSTQVRAIVTGASNGIGEAITCALAAAGVTVVMIGRDDQRLIAARERVLAKISDADLHVARADLALMSEVRQLAARLADQPAPDIVISNAATITAVRDMTSEGLPRTLATNHLAPYLLLRSMIASIGDHPARFIVLGANPASLADDPVDLDDLFAADEESLGEPVELRPFRFYRRTKNMNAMFVYALAQRLDFSRITVNGVHPGHIGGTGLHRMEPEQTAAAMAAAIARLNLDPTTFPPPEIGADTPVWLATSSEVADINGTFFVDRKPVQTAPHTTDPGRCERLWKQSAQLCDLPADL